MGSIESGINTDSRMLLHLKCSSWFLPLSASFQQENCGAGGAFGTSRRDQRAGRRSKEVGCADAQFVGQQAGKRYHQDMFFLRLLVLAKIHRLMSVGYFVFACGGIGKNRRKSSENNGKLIGLTEWDVYDLYAIGFATLLSL